MNVGVRLLHLHEVRDVPALDALLEDLHRREAHALGPDVLRVDVVAARHAAAGVGVVALDGGDQHHLAGVEDRREDVVVGQVAAAVVGIVGDQHVALEQAVGAEELEREAHRQRRAEHELRDADADSAARAPRASRMVALRSFDWLRIGVVAVRLTCVAIS